MIGVMIDSWIVLPVSLAYIGLLFLIAWAGDRQAERDGIDRRPGGRWLYALTLGVYCTSWTFLGSVGRAAASGFDFIPIYIGPTLVLVLAWPLLVKLVTIAKAQNITSIADFIAARYGKSQAVAALVTIIAAVSIVPYIALQLKAVASSYDVLVSGAALDAIDHPWWSDTALWVALSMALFSILFGVRSLHASEHHRGLMLAVAFESLVKLTAFLVVGGFVTYGLFDGFGDILDRVETMPHIAPLLRLNLADPAWWTMTVLSAFAFLCLPRQFHVSVVECTSTRDIRFASWTFPLYLIAINLFVLPIALAGLLLFGSARVNPDTFVLSVPMASGYPGITLIAFIGGLSAATSMVIVAAVALSTMISNDLVMPMLLRFKALHPSEGRSPAGLLLLVRRGTIVLLLLWAYLYDRLIAESYPLSAIGLISFAGVAQFAPAMLGGLYWKGGTRAGALAGLSIGLVVWVYTLVLPSFVPTGWPDASFLSDGPFGLHWLRPQALLGWDALDPLSHAAVWSLLLNSVAYVSVSLQLRGRMIERMQAVAFVEAVEPGRAVATGSEIPANLAELSALVARFLGPEQARSAFADYLQRNPGAAQRAGLDAVRFTERLLAGAIGAASARVVMAISLEGKSLSRREVMRILDTASEAIKSNRELLQATLENMAQGVCVFDSGQRLATWNKRFLTLLDLPESQIRVGTTLQDIVDFNADRGEYDQTGFGSWITSRLPMAPFNYERQRPDGTVLEISSNAMPDGGFVVTFTDITQRKRTENALRESERSIRVYTDNLPVLIAYVDRDEKLRFTNRAYDEALGLSRDTAKGMPLAVAQGPQRYTVLVPRIRAALAGRRQSFEAMLPGQGGAPRYAEVTYVPDISDNEVQGFFAVYHDVTTRRQAEQALKDAYESLERRVEERTEALQAAKQEAERANQSKTRFLAAASHDLLQPLNAARLFVSALSDRRQNRENRTLIDNVDASLKSVEHLLGALLDISRLDAGGLKAEPGVVPLAGLFSTLGLEFAALAKEKGLELRVLPTKLAVRSDPRLLRRILQNYLSNAIRYTEKGGVMLGCRQRGDQVMISVWDTGPGIPADRLGEIYQEFRRLGPDRGGADKGLGLGLAIVERMANMLEHPLAVRSHVGRGSCFSVTVPLTALPEPTAVPVQRRSVGDLGGAVVLCLDNEPAILEGMAALLTGWSCHVLTATNLDEAMEAAQNSAPAALIADYHLDAGANGIDALLALRAQCGPQTPAILITADRNDTVQELTDQNGIDLLHKPLKPAALRALLTRMLSRREASNRYDQEVV